MNVLIYVNNLKNKADKYAEELISALDKNGISYSFIDNDNLDKSVDADCIFVFGGDGTILNLTDFCLKNDIPIIGINAGNIGFLAEFEVKEIEESVKFLKDGKLTKDNRLVLIANYGGKEYLALNDCVISRIYKENYTGLLVNLDVCIDDKPVASIKGDGAIISTPTGSTAYSLSAGGAILAPGINAFSLTPISAHSLSSRPVIFSADKKCEINVKSDNAAMFIDGKMVSLIEKGNKIETYKCDKELVFYRRENSDFYGKLSQKLSAKGVL